MSTRVNQVENDDPDCAKPWNFIATANSMPDNKLSMFTMPRTESGRLRVLR